MRILYIAGFFAPVLVRIQNEAKAYLDDRSVVWIQQRADRRGQLDINSLKSDLLDQARRGATHIHVCCFIFRGHEHVLESLESIKQWAITRHPGLDVTIERFRNAQDADGVLARISDFGPNRESAFPESLQDLETWTSQRCNGKVLLHPRALRGAKASQYEEIALIYQALLLLAEEYWELRTATPETRQAKHQAFNARLNLFGLIYAPSITDTRAGEQGTDYDVFYPLGTQQKQKLEFHLKKGVDRDARNCLRIYFFWDPEARMTVVGWMTSHLGTRAS